MSPARTEYTARVAAWLVQLGIPPDYGARRQLQVLEEAQDLVPAGTSPTGNLCLLSAPTAAAWQRLQSAAIADGVQLLPVSGYRSAARQAEIVSAKLRKGQSLDSILRSVAAPGYSEHHTGRAVDIATPGDPPLEPSFAATPAYAWLVQHARHFGFQLSFPPENPHGIVFEPWHWLWNPGILSGNAP